MTVTAPIFHKSSNVSASHQKPMERVVKNPAQTANETKKTARCVFARMLWTAFPASSERDLARRASAVLDVSERQVINWLRCDHDASVSVVFAVMAIAGAEIVFARAAA